MLTGNTLANKLDGAGGADTEGRVTGAVRVRMCRSVAPLLRVSV